MTRYQAGKIRKFYLAGHYLEEKNPFAVNQKEVRQNAIHIQKLYEECTYLLQNGIRSMDELDRHLKQLREKEAALKNERSTQYVSRDDALIKKYCGMQKKLADIPAEDDSFEELQEELIELEGKLPDEIEETAGDKGECIRSELSAVRREIRIARRIRREEEKAPERRTFKTVKVQKEA